VQPVQQVDTAFERLGLLRHAPQPESEPLAHDARQRGVEIGEVRREELA
jgi:hypothetical protein